MQPGKQQKTREQIFENKEMYGNFKQQANEISLEITGTRLRKGNIKKETESIQIVTHNNPIKQIKLKWKLITRNRIGSADYLEKKIK